MINKTLKMITFTPNTVSNNHTKLKKNAKNNARDYSQYKICSLLNTRCTVMNSIKAFSFLHRA